MLKELFDPILDFYEIRRHRKKELLFYVGIPLLIAIFPLLLCKITNPAELPDIWSFASGITDKLLTITLLSTGSAMLLTVAFAAGRSAAIDRLKQTASKDYTLGSKSITLYQALISDLTYLILTGILYISFLILQEIFLYALPASWLKLLVAADLFWLLHILLVFMNAVKNMYFSFWRT